MLMINSCVHVCVCVSACGWVHVSACQKSILKMLFISQNQWLKIMYSSLDSTQVYCGCFPSPCLSQDPTFVFGLPYHRFHGSIPVDHEMVPISPGIDRRPRRQPKNIPPEVAWGSSVVNGTSHQQSSGCLELGSLPSTCKYHLQKLKCISNCTGKFKQT